MCTFMYKCHRNPIKSILSDNSVILCLIMGDSRKYPYLYHGQLLGFPKGRRGSLNWNSEGMGVFTIGNPKALGGFHRWDF